LFFNVIKWEKVHFKHPSREARHKQKNDTPQKLGNFILFRMFLEATVFNIAIKYTSENMKPPPWLP
jgi:hypothetical protein